MIKEFFMGVGKVILAIIFLFVSMFVLMLSFALIFKFFIYNPITFFIIITIILCTIGGVHEIMIAKKGEKK